MQFGYANSIREEFPELVTGLLQVEGITKGEDVSRFTAHFYALANARLGTDTEAALPEIQAWRHAFARMGLKPTQYRCASEALLRRFRKERSLPPIHPLIDLCNAISLAFAVPIAAFDLARISGELEVRRAVGDEIYDTFSGEIEHPDVGEVIFADSSSRAHARRWTNRQSGYSAVRDDTSRVLIVAEAMHPAAAADMLRLKRALTAAIEETWPLAKVVEI